MNRKISLSLPFRLSMLAGVLIIWLILSFITVGVYSILLAAAALLASDIIISGMLVKLKRGRRAAANALLTLVSLFFFISISVNSLAQTMLFFPHANEEVYSVLKKRSEVEELTVTARDGNISGWLMPSPDDTAPLLLYFCGNAEDASARMLSVLCSSTYQETFAGCSFAVFDYPGYGRSDGKPTEASKNDEMIPYESSVRLSEVYPAGCDFKLFEELRHNDFWGSTKALGYIRVYLQLLITE